MRKDFACEEITWFNLEISIRSSRLIPVTYAKLTFSPEQSKAFFEDLFACLSGACH